MNRKKVVIVGGGITGLSCAYFLQEKIRKGGFPIDCSLIESEKGVGGKIVTKRIDDFIIEGGPDSFITQKPWGLDLCSRLGLTDRLIKTNRVENAIYVLCNGKLVPLPAGFNLMVPGRFTPFLRTPLISPFGKVRMGLELIIPRKDYMGGEDESIASFVRRRLGEEAVRKFAEPILAGIYGGDVERLSLMATFPQFSALERSFGSLIWGMLMQRWDAAQQGIRKGDWTLFVTLREGLGSLIQSLQERLKDVSICAGKRVIGLSPRENGYEVRLESEVFSSDAVVITTNAGVASDLIRGWAPSLAGFLDQIEYVSTATVSLGFRKEDVVHPLRGFGFVVPRRENRKILAVTWTSTKFSERAPAGHVLIRVFLGGVHQEQWVEQEDTTLISIARAELRDILALRAEPTVTRVFRWVKENPQYNVGHLERIEKIEQQAATHPGLFLAGAAYRGVGIPDCIHQGMKASEGVGRFFGLT